MCLAYMSDPELRALSIKTYGSEYLEKIAQELNISVDEAFILDQQNAYWFWLHWGQFASTTNADDEKELDNLIRTFYNSRPIRVCWENSAWHKPLLDKRFIAYVEERFE